MKKIKAKSFTTGSEKWFLLSDEEYEKRFTHYPAWYFYEDTLEENIFAPEN